MIAKFENFEDDDNEISATATPADLGLHHAEWRPRQLDIIRDLSIASGYVILSAPTGSGKTSIAKALASTHTVTALCRTKGLQSENYRDEYGFDAMFGKGNYPCAHPEYKGTFADTCAYADAGMRTCPHADECTYLIQKDRVMSSGKRSLNYAYWLSAHWPREYTSNTLVLDEAHQLSEITLEWAGIDMSNKVRQELGLEDFPEISGAENRSIFFESNSKTPVEQANAWIEQSISRLERKLGNLRAADTLDTKARRELTRTESWLRKMEATTAAIARKPTDWYVQSGRAIEKDWKTGMWLPKFIIKPLSARYHFDHYFGYGEKVIMMSATIGSPQAFAEELGIGDQYKFITMPNQWPAETRPIFDLGAPSIGQKASPLDYDRQAEVIANAIKQCPSNWSGVIHVTRKSEAGLLANRLNNKGLYGRIWTPAVTDGTDEQMRKWEAEKRASGKLGKIAISWTWWEGVNLTEERICIVAKTPYPFLGSPYEVARRNYSGKTYLWRTAVQLEQALGRTRRGEAEDYDIGNGRNQLVAIADANWKRVRNYLSTDLMEAVRSL